MEKFEEIKEGITGLAAREIINNNFKKIKLSEGDDSPIKTVFSAQPNAQKDVTFGDVLKNGGLKAEIHPDENTTEIVEITKDRNLIKNLQSNPDGSRTDKQMELSADSLEFVNDFHDEISTSPINATITTRIDDSGFVNVSYANGHSKIIQAGIQDGFKVYNPNEQNKIIDGKLVTCYDEYVKVNEKGFEFGNNSQVDGYSEIPTFRITEDEVSGTSEFREKFNNWIGASDIEYTDTRINDGLFKFNENKNLSFFKLFDTDIALVEAEALSAYTTIYLFYKNTSETDRKITLPNMDDYECFGANEIVVPSSEIVEIAIKGYGDKRVITYVVNGATSGGGDVKTVFGESPDEDQDINFTESLYNNRFKSFKRIELDPNNSEHDNVFTELTPQKLKFTKAYSKIDYNISEMTTIWESVTSDVNNISINNTTTVRQDNVEEGINTENTTIKDSNISSDKGFHNISHITKRDSYQTPSIIEDKYDASLNAIDGLLLEHNDEKVFQVNKEIVEGNDKCKDNFKTWLGIGTGDGEDFVNTTGDVMTGRLTFDDGDIELRQNGSHYNRIFVKRNVQEIDKNNIHFEASVGGGSILNVGGIRAYSAARANGLIVGAKIQNYNSDDNHVLLGGGGTKPLSEFTSGGSTIGNIDYSLEE